MIVGADMLFQDLPIDFGDPVSLASSQLPGKLTLIVACYPGPVYDAFVCKAPVIVSVAHVTPAFKFPIPVSRAMARYFDARKNEVSALLSLYEIDRPLASLFLESVYFEPSVKLPVIGKKGALDFIQHQIELAGCADGILECADFSDPLHPLIALHPAPSEWPAEIAALSTSPNKQIIIYDRKKNQAAARGRGASALDIGAMLEQGAHYAKLVQEDAAQLLHLATQREDAYAQADTWEAEEVESILQKPREETQLIEEMASLIAGDPAMLLDDVAITDEGVHGATIAIEVDSPEVEPPALQPQTLGEEGQKLMADLRKIYMAVMRELSRQFGEDRANILIGQAADTLSLELPLSDFEVLPFLQALVSAKPPKRWMRFKSRMNEVKDLLATDLTALFAEYNHLAEAPLMQEVSELWCRCSKG